MSDPGQRTFAQHHAAAALANRAVSRIGHFSFSRMIRHMSSEPQKSWQARIGEATDALAQSFVESISYDKRLYKHDIAGSLAHAAMLAKVGLITEPERAKIEQGLRSIEQDIEADKLPFD